MLHILVGIAVLCFVLWLAHEFFPYRFTSLKYQRLIDKIPGPPGVPVLGIGLELNVPAEEFLPYLKKLYEKYYPIYKVWFLGIPAVFLADPMGVEKVLSSQQYITKGDEYLILVPWLNTGLLTSTGIKWHTRRKILTPAFHFRILEDYINVFNRNSQLLVKILAENAKKSPVQINKYMTNCTLDIICETAMGTSVNAQTDGQSKYVAAVKRMSELFQYRQLRFWTHRPIPFRLSPIYNEQERVLRILHGFTENVIQERKLEYKLKRDDLKKNAKRKQNSLLDLLIEISETDGGLTDLDIREEVDTFMFEGHDTTAAAISWSLYLIGSHPDVQDRLEEELKGIFGKSDREVNAEDLQAMRYLEQVIKESLRMFPSVPILSRKLDVELNVHGYTIPPETQIVIMPLFMHLNPDLYPEPYKFDPGRFSPENIVSRHPFGYLPFSAGPRNCIGQKFALMEEKTVISTVLRNFRVNSLQKMKDIKLMGELILRPKDGIMLQLTRKE